MAIDTNSVRIEGWMDRYFFFPMSNTFLGSVKVGKHLVVPQSSVSMAVSDHNSPPHSASFQAVPRPLTGTSRFLRWHLPYLLREAICPRLKGNDITLPQLASSRVPSAGRLTVHEERAVSSGCGRVRRS